MEQSTKLLGGISYIVLIVFDIVGGFAHPLHIITLIASICVLIAFIRGGSEVGRPEVKRDIITALVLYIVAACLFIFLVGSSVAAYVLHQHHHNMGAAAIGAGAIIGGLIGWVLFIIAAWFWYKASVPLAEATGVGLYKTGGLLLFIGSITIVVFGLGFLVMLIGEILQCVAFFTTPDKNALATSMPPPEAPAT